MVAIWLATAASARISLPVAVLLVAVLGLFPASEVAVQIVNYLVTVLLPPTSLPKLSFEDGIPPEWRTLVVVPVILRSADEVRSDSSAWRRRFLSNQDENLRFALLADFPDAPAVEMPEDEALAEGGGDRITALNGKYGDEAVSLFFQDSRLEQERAVLDGVGAQEREAGGANRWLAHATDGILPGDGDAGTIH